MRFLSYELYKHLIFTWFKHDKDGRYKQGLGASQHSYPLSSDDLLALLDMDQEV